MSWESEISDCETCEIWYDTATGETKIEDLVNDEVWRTPIDQDGTDWIAANIVPGFKFGKWAIIIGKKIKEALVP